MIGTVPKVGRNGQLMQPLGRNTTTKIVAVTGPPCAGKSTFIHERAQPGDLVVEFDRINMALSPVGDHDHHDQVKPFVHAAQTAVLNRLKMASDVERAWLSALAPTNKQRRRYLINDDTRLLVLMLDPEIAHDRAGWAERPQAWHDLIDDWYATVEDPNDPRVELVHV